MEDLIIDLLPNVSDIVISQSNPTVSPSTIWSVEGGRIVQNSPITLTKNSGTTLFYPQMRIGSSDSSSYIDLHELDVDWESYKNNGYKLSIGTEGDVSTNRPDRINFSSTVSIDAGSPYDRFSGESYREWMLDMGLPPYIYIPPFYFYHTVSAGTATVEDFWISDIALKLILTAPSEDYSLEDITWDSKSLVKDLSCEVPGTISKFTPTDMEMFVSDNWMGGSRGKGVCQNSVVAGFANVEPISLNVDDYQFDLVGQNIILRRFRHPLLEYIEYRNAPILIEVRGTLQIGNQEVPTMMRAYSGGKGGEAA